MTTGQLMAIGVLLLIVGTIWKLLAGKKTPGAALFFIAAGLGGVLLASFFLLFPYIIGAEEISRELFVLGSGVVLSIVAALRCLFCLLELSDRKRDSRIPYLYRKEEE